MKWIFVPLKRYAVFDGRSPRVEFWSFFGVLVGLVALLSITAMVLSYNLAPPGSSGPVSPWIGLPLVLAGILLIGTILPLIAVIARRLHDRDLSGWFVLIVLIPYIGWLILIAFMVLPGSDGENSHGPNPLQPGTSDPDQLEQIFG